MPCLHLQQAAVSSPEAEAHTEGVQAVQRAVCLTVNVKDRSCTSKDARVVLITQPRRTSSATSPLQETHNQGSHLLWLARAPLGCGQSSISAAVPGQGRHRAPGVCVCGLAGRTEHSLLETLHSVGVNAPPPPREFTMLMYPSQESISSVGCSVIPSVSLFTLIENHLIALLILLSSPRARN